LKIKLTAETRVLLSAGTIVDVSPETAAVIRRLGRCVYVKENAAETKKAEKVEKNLNSSGAEKPKKGKKKVED
jgi:hypothetical protein